MKQPRIHLKNFLLVILAFSMMTFLCLDSLSSVPTKSDSSLPGELSGVYTRSLIVRDNGHQTWSSLLNALYQLGTTILQQPKYSSENRKPKSVEKRLWPYGLNENSSRILNQLEFHISKSQVPVNSSAEDKKHLKKILAFSGLGKTKRGQQVFLDDGCLVDTCYLTDNHNDGPIADAVLFQNYLAKPAFEKSANQIWIMFLLESPMNTQHFPQFQNLINMTATYRLDSTIVTPYEIFVPYENASDYKTDERNYALGKTKQVAWFVSNCRTSNNRMNYALELSKYISVDIYGPCGKFKCPKHQKEQCYQRLKNDYKFYLAFENSNCKDYITEKFYWNALLNDVLPVVMGARPEDYAKVAPADSYIHVDNFESPKDLAQYLHTLDKNDKLYNRYFRWKGSGHYINTKFWCRLCSMIHDNTRKSWYEDIETWWRGPGICVSSTTSNIYASWKNANDFTRISVNNTNIRKRFEPQYIRISSNTSSVNY